MAVERREGEQAHIVTTREDLPALEVAYRMFGRWRQESFFKYLREHFALDALVSYQTRPDDPERQVPNPRWRALSKRRGKVRAELKALETALGRLEAPPATPADKRSHPSREELVAKIEKKRAQALRLYGRLKALPRRVPLKEVATEGGAVLLEDERKRFTDVVKLAAYDGFDPHSARQVGPRTGDPAGVTSFEQLWDAYKAQLEHWAERAAYWSNCGELAQEDLDPLPYLSILTSDCIERGLDIAWGGAHFNYHSTCAIGIPNVADSLAAVRGLVFEQQTGAFPRRAQYSDATGAGPGVKPPAASSHRRQIDEPASAR